MALKDQRLVRGRDGHLYMRTSRLNKIWQVRRLGANSKVEARRSEQRTLTPSILVRIQVPQPYTSLIYFQFPRSPKLSRYFRALALRRTHRRQPETSNA